MDSIFETYKEQIRLKFESEKTGVNGNYLINPTSGNLKKLAQELVLGELNPADEIIVKRFFKKGEKISANFVKATHVDTFKNVSKFLRNEGNVNAISDIDFAALSVGLEDRPYAKFRKIIRGEYIEPQPEPKNEKTNESPLESSEKTVVSSNRKKSNLLVLLFLAIVGFVGGFWLYSSNEKQCMVWNGACYEKVDCEKNSTLGIVHFSQIISLHEETLHNFKKIQPDSTTQFFKNGKATVYYSKHNNNVEFFSCDGVHPVTKKDLKPVTDYIVKKYVYKKGISHE